MQQCEKERAISCMKLAIELAGDGGPQPFTDVEYKLMYQLLDELNETSSQSTQNNEKGIVTVDEDDFDNFFTDEYEDYKKIVGKCFMSKHMGIAVKVLLVPDDTDHNLEPYEFIYERFDEFSFGGWEIEDYNWLQEQTDKMYNRYKITPYANLNNASENMFHVGKNGNLYTSVDCGDEWYEFTEISNEEFEKIRNEAIEIIKI